MSCVRTWSVDTVELYYIAAVLRVFPVLLQPMFGLFVHTVIDIGFLNTTLNYAMHYSHFHLPMVIQQRMLQQLCRYFNAFPWGPFYWYGVTLIPAWKCNYIRIICEMKFLIHSQTSMVQLVKLGDGYMISSHTLLWIWLHIHRVQWNLVKRSRMISKGKHIMLRPHSFSFQSFNLYFQTLYIIPDMCSGYTYLLYTSKCILLMDRKICIHDILCIFL